MIERLRKRDLNEAARVFFEGMLLEKPPGRGTLSSIETHLRECIVFVDKEKGRIVGLISGREIAKGLRITFICALRQRCGIGSALMRRIAQYCVRKRIRFVYSNVSLQDERALRFYEKCGFKVYGRYSVDYISSKDLTLLRIKAEPRIILSALSLKSC